jgi:hypothetical protein
MERAVMDSSEPTMASKTGPSSSREICGGAVLSDGTEWYPLVLDSSSTNAVDAKFDGSGCGTAAREMSRHVRRE